jgi:hypothetical protein
VNTAGINDKFCDVNGDGLVDNTDLNAFNVFYYSSPVYVPYRMSSLPDVTFVPVSNIVNAGDTAAFYIIAGLTTPIDSVSGIAFTNFGNLNVAFHSVDFLPNNLGIPVTDTRTFCSPPYSTNFGNVVLSRIDRTNKHLNGDTIGIIKFIIPANYTDTTFSTSITGIKAILGNGTDVPVVAVNGTVTVSIQSSIQTIFGNEIYLFPNPAKDLIQIGKKYARQKAEIYNSMGKCVMSFPVSFNGSLDISGLSEGIYFLKLLPENSCTRFVVGK